MPIRFTCKCGKRFKVDEKFAGKRARCPNCHLEFVVPPAAAAPPEPAAKAAPAPPEPPPEPELEAPNPDQTAEFLAQAEEARDAPEASFELEAPSADQTKAFRGISAQDGPPAELSLDLAPLGQDETAAPASPPPSEEAEPVPALELAPDRILTTADEAAEHVLPALDESAGLDIAPPEPLEQTPADDAYPTAAAAPPPPGAPVCPKCGAAIESGAAICLGCGTKLGGPPAAAAPPATRKRQTPVVIAIAAGIVVLVGLLAGIGYFAYSKLTGGKKKTPAASATTRPPAAVKPATGPGRPGPAKPAPAGPKPTVPAKTQVPPKPPPVVARAWPGFSDPALHDRDRLLSLGRGLAEYRRQNARGPADLAALGLPPEKTSRLKLLGAEVRALERFRPLAHATTPGKDGLTYVLFSDGSVRPVAASELAAIIPVKTPDGWLTPADQAALARLQPILRVRNDRFHTLRVSVNGAARGQVARGTSREFDLAPGKGLTIALAAGDKGAAASLTLDAARGLIYDCAIPRHQDLPVVPGKFYRERCFSRRQSAYTVKKSLEDKVYVVRALTSAYETVEFPGAGGGRKAFAPAQEFREVNARITRGDHTLTGVDGRPIVTSGIARLQEGVLRHACGQRVVYQGTPLGTLTIRTEVNTRLAGLLRLKSAPVEDADASQPIPDRPYTAAADLGPMSKALLEIAPAVLRHVIEQTQATPKYWQPPAPSPGAARGGPRAAETPSRDEPVREPGKRPRLDAEVAKGWLTPPNALPAPAAAGDLLATLAVYGDTRAWPHLSELSVQLGATVRNHPDFTMAAARIGRRKALTHLAAHESAASRAMNAAASTMVGGPLAEKVLRELLTGQGAGDLIQAAAGWPAAAGAASRRAFVEAVARYRPNLLEGPDVLNALLRIEPCATERAVLASFLEATAPPKAKPAAKAPAKARRPPQQQARRPEHERDPPRRRGDQRAKRAAKPEDAPYSWRLLAARRNTEAVRRMVALLEGSNATHKRRALAALVETREPTLAGSIQPLLHQAGLQAEAARVMILLGDPAGLQAVIAAMNAKIATPDVLSAVTSSVARTGRTASADLLASIVTAALKVEKPPAKDADAAKGGQRKPRGIFEMRKAQEPTDKGKEGPPPLSTRALEAIAALGVRTDAVARALEAARNAADPRSRAAAYRTLAAIAPPGGAPAAVSIEAIDKALGDAEPRVRAEGIRLLQKTEAPAGTLATRLEAALSDADPAVRCAVMGATPVLKGDAAKIRRIVAAGLKDADQEVVRAAALAAAGRKDAELAQPLIAALNRPVKGAGDDGPVGLIAVIQAVGALKARGAAGALQLLLRQGNAKVALAATAALRAIKDPATLPALITLGGSADKDLVDAAVGALLEFRSTQAQWALVDMLHGGRIPEQREREVLALYAGLVGSSERFRERAKSGPPLSLEHVQGLALLASGRPRGDDRLIAARAEGFRVIAGRYLADASVSGITRPVRSTGMGAMGLRQPRQAAQPERPTLDDRTREQLKRMETPRAAAAFILANLRDEGEARALLLKAFRSNAEGISEAVAQAVSAERDPGAAKMLKDLYTDLLDSLAKETKVSAGLAAATKEENKAVRLAVIEALGRMKGAEATRTLRSLTAYEKEPEPRRAIIRAYAYTPSQERVAHIIQLASRSRDYHAAAIEALGRAGYADEAGARETLEKFVTSRQTPINLSALAADALDDLNCLVAGRQGAAGASSLRKK